MHSKVAFQHGPTILQRVLARTMHRPISLGIRFRVSPSPALVAVPAMDYRVASTFASFNAATDESPGHPEASTLTTPVDESSGCPKPCIYRLAGDGSSSRLDFRILKRYWLTSLRVAPHLRSSVAPADEVSGRPDPCIYRLCLGSEFPGCPESSLL
jgi:hypothetical protein